MTQQKKKREMYKLTKMQTRFVIIFASIIALAVVIIPIVLSLVEKRKENTISCKVTISTGIPEIQDYSFKVRYGTKIEEIKTKLQEAAGYYLIGVYSDSERLDSLDNKDKLKQDKTLYLKYDLIFALDNFDDGYAIKGIKSQYLSNENIVIPATHSGKKIIAIANSAFFGNSKIKTVRMSDNIISIGDNAFLNCSKLENIILSNNLESIGTSAFSLCRSLNNIIIPESVKEIKTSAFIECINLKLITIKSLDVYRAMNGDSELDAGYIHKFAEEIKVLKLADDGTNTYINNNYIKTEGEEYNTYTKNLA